LGGLQDFSRNLQQIGKIIMIEWIVITLLIIAFGIYAYKQAKKEQLRTTQIRYLRDRISGLSKSVRTLFEAAGGKMPEA